MTAVLTRSPTDVLSHVAIRARSQGVLLATCFDEAALSNIKQLEGKNVQLDVDATGAVTATESAAPSATDGTVPKSGVHPLLYVYPCMGIPFVRQGQGLPRAFKPSQVRQKDQGDAYCSAGTNQWC